MWAHHGHRRQATVPGVEVEQRAEIDVCHTVCIGRAEGAAGEPVCKLRKPSSGGRIDAGVDALDRDVTGPRLLGRELLYGLTQVARGQQEALKSLRGVDL